MWPTLAVALAARLGPSYAQHGAEWPGACAAASGQSPVDFEALGLAPSKTLQFAYEELRELDFMAVGATAQVLGKNGSCSVVVDNTQYVLDHVAVHAPAEHSVRGERAGAELQLVHSAGARKLILSLLVHSPTAPLAANGAPFAEPPAFDLDYNAFVAPLIEDKGPAKEGPRPNVTWNATALFDTLTGPATFWQYDGSETAPPCAPVRWFVRREPMRASDAQIQQLVNAAGALTGGAGNYRTVAAWGDRKPIVWRSRPGSHVEEAPPRLRSGPHPRTDGELQAVGQAEAARDLARHAVKYVKDLETRAQESADQHLERLQAERRQEEEAAMAARAAAGKEQAEWLEPVAAKHFLPRVPALATEAAEKVVQGVREAAASAAARATQGLSQEVMRQQALQP